MIKISKNSEQILSCIASGVPPVEWQNEYKTPAQIKHQDNVCYKYQCVHSELQSFFRGQESSIKNNELNELEKNYYTALADYYIAVYACIRKAWRVIQTEAKKKNIQIPDSPGEAIVQVFVDSYRQELLHFSQNPSHKISDKIIDFYLKVVEQESKKDELLYSSRIYLKDVFKNIGLFSDRLNKSRGTVPNHDLVSDTRKSCK